MTQLKCSKELLAECGLDVSKRAKTPLPTTRRRTATEGKLYANPEHYICLIGKLIFLTHTWPDLCFAVQTLSQFMHQPRHCHLQPLHHVLRYLAYTLGHSVLLRATAHLTLQAYSNLAWHLAMTPEGLSLAMCCCLVIL